MNPIANKVIAREVLVVVIIFTMLLLVGCSNLSTDATYKSDYSGVSFKYPRNFHVMYMGMAKKISSETMRLYEKNPYEGILISITDLDEIKDIFSETFQQEYRTYVRYGSGDRMIIIDKSNIYVFINQFFVNIDCWFRPEPPRTVEIAQLKDISFNIAKSVEFTKHKTGKTNITNSSEASENLISIIIQKTTLYYNGYLSKQRIGPITDEMISEPKYATIVQKAKDEAAMYIKDFNEKLKKSVK